jgi:hypothetical protein
LEIGRVIGFCEGEEDVVKAYLNKKQGISDDDEKFWGMELNEVV